MKQATELTYEQRKELQGGWAKAVIENDFQWFVTVKPNEVMLYKGRPLLEMHDEIMKRVNLKLFGRDCPAPEKRKDLLQGISFFEGEDDKHWHQSLFSRNTVDRERLKAVFERVVQAMYPGTTVDVQAITNRNREKIAWYIVKHLWHPSSLNMIKVFGPHPDEPMCVPPTKEECEGDCKRQADDRFLQVKQRRPKLASNAIPGSTDAGQASVVSRDRPANDNLPTAQDPAGRRPEKRVRQWLGQNIHLAKQMAVRTWDAATRVTARMWEWIPGRR